MVSGWCFSGVGQFSVVKRTPTCSAMSLKRICPGPASIAQRIDTPSTTTPKIVPNKMGSHRTRLARSVRWFTNRDDLVRLNIVQSLNDAARPRDLKRPDCLVAAQSEVHAQVIRRKITPPA